MLHIDPSDYRGIVFFTGAGMSAESGVPTYRGRGGIWASYDYEEYACQAAFERDPEKVLRFHEMRREAVQACAPHAGHRALVTLEQERPDDVLVVTQNTDGMHQRAGSRRVLELHGSLWRVRCPRHGTWEDWGARYAAYRCEGCGAWLRPDLVWFGDVLDQRVLAEVAAAIQACDLFVSVGTSGVVWPAAGFQELAAGYILE